MPKGHVPCPEARFQGWPDNVRTHVNGRSADSGFPVGVMGTEIRGRIAEASAPGLAPWSEYMGAIHGSSGPTRLSRTAHLGTMTA